jgi:hypothetical protein
MWRRDMRLPSDSKFGMKKPAADFSAAGFMIFAMMKICR